MMRRPLFLAAFVVAGCSPARPPDRSPEAPPPPARSAAPEGEEDPPAMADGTPGASDEEDGAAGMDGDDGEERDEAKDGEEAKDPQPVVPAPPKGPPPKTPLVKGADPGHFAVVSSFCGIATYDESLYGRRWGCRGCAPFARPDGKVVRQPDAFQAFAGGITRGSFTGRGRDQALVPFDECHRDGMRHAQTATALVERNAHGGYDVLRYEDYTATDGGCWTVPTKEHDLLACISAIDGGSDGYAGVFLTDFSGTEAHMTRLVNVHFNASLFCMLEPEGRMQYFRGTKLAPFDVNGDGLADLRVQANFVDEDATPAMKRRFERLCAAAGGEPMSSVKRSAYLHMRTQTLIWRQQPDGTFEPDPKTASWVARMDDPD